MDFTPPTPDETTDLDRLLFAERTARPATVRPSQGPRPSRAPQHLHDPPTDPDPAGALAPARSRSPPTLTHKLLVQGRKLHTQYVQEDRAREAALEFIRDHVQANPISSGGASDTLAAPSGSGASSSRIPPPDVAACPTDVEAAARQQNLTTGTARPRVTWMDEIGGALVVVNSIEVDGKGR